MAESMYEKHETSDEYLDSYCDPCFGAKGLKVNVHGYCKDCFQFLCSDCHVLHGKFQITKGHVIVQGSSMPKPQADKPPKFHHCYDHPALVKDQFCCEHKNMICSSCSSNHTNCIVKSIEDVCKNISPSETDSLYDAVKDLQDQVRLVMLSVETNIKKIKEQKKSMLKEAQNVHDKVILKINTLFQDMQTDIEANCQSQILLMSQHQEKINAIVAKLESSTTDIEPFQGKPIDTKLFLKIQENVSDINQITDEFRTLSQSLPSLDLSFIQNRTMHEFLSTSFTLGTVLKTKRGTNIVARDIVFPSDNQPPKGAVVVKAKQSDGNMQGAAVFKKVPVSHIKGAKQCNYQVKLKEDKKNCYIKGMSITGDGRILMADNMNDTVKLFSRTMKFLSSVSHPDSPCGVAAINDREAAATTSNESLVQLDISGSQLYIKATTKVPYDIRGISKYNNKLVISSDSPISCVKLIDLSGKVYWSVSCDQQGQSLFSQSWYLTSHGEGRSSTVIVSDWDNNTLTLLSGETGEVITKRQMQKKRPTGVTTDTAGNVYVCYFVTEEVSVLSEDLSEEKTLLSAQDGLSGGPLAIVYDDKTQQLFISYPHNDIVDSFKLS